MAMRDLFGAAVVAAVVSAGTTYALQRTMSQQDAVEVPSVLGLPGQSARELVESRGFMFVVGEEREEAKTPAGTVVAQKPLQGSRIERGQRVEVVLAKAPAPVKMPGLAGLELADAKARIEAAKLVVGKVTEENSDEVKAGSVISQVPAQGGEAKVGTAVDLVVSKGVATIAVPQVVGRSLGRAKADLVKAGFAVGTVKARYDEDRSDGLVLDQNPAADQQAAKGSAVDLIVNRTD
ncbi:MAG: PASTA domain-containing protein [Deltaproteobacteria bacterium]|jgi:beta-lactam-binding protein with PASTA domain|nr:PASTA domain-containing protein [Deltaproteobacteria bacterium]